MLLNEIFVFGIAFAVICCFVNQHNERERTRKARDFHPRVVENKGRDNSAGFADGKRLKPLLTGRGVRIGRSPDGKHVLRYPGPGHILIVAAARRGKGATILIPMLLEPFRR